MSKRNTSAAAAPVTLAPSGTLKIAIFDNGAGGIFVTGWNDSIGPVTANDLEGMGAIHAGPGALMTIADLDLSTIPVAGMVAHTVRDASIVLAERKALAVAAKAQEAAAKAAAKAQETAAKAAAKAQEAAAKAAAKAQEAAAKAAAKAQETATPAA